MIIEIITLFPEGVQAMLSESMIARAQRFGALELEIVQLRDFTDDKHNTVDDKPFGGGPGMVLKPEPVAKAIDWCREKRSEPAPFVLYTSPQGRRFDQKMAEELSQKERVIILCGHYKGLDQRAIDTVVDQEVSIGDYILTGGEAAAVVITDAVSRLLPGVLHDPESAAGDSFTRGLLDHPHYTQPADWRGMEVPPVLTSGHHAKVEEWRLDKAVEATRELRPEMLESWLKTPDGLAYRKAKERLARKKKKR